MTEDTDAATALKNWFSAVQEYPDAADVEQNPDEEQGETA